MATAPRARSLKPFREYVELETANLVNSSLSAVAPDGALLEYETLELRVHPTNVVIDNETREDSTLITVDSANRPGTLVELVQCLTKLRLHIRQARISSDRGWFVDDFYVTEADGRKVTDEKKLGVIRKVLSVEPLGRSSAASESAVLELAGKDSPGLLADVTTLLGKSGFSVQAASVWTYKSKAAFAISVSQGNHGIIDYTRLEALCQVMQDMMGGQGKGVATMHKVQGDQHLEHRLHLLLLEQEKKRCRNKPENGGSAAISLPPPSPRVAPGENPLEQYRSPKHCYPDVTLKPMSRLGYWVVRVGCKDRDKLLFDVVCTFADMDYDVYHGTVDCDGKVAFLEFYIRPRFHEVEWDDDRMETLKYLLEAAIRRRFPKGLKLHVHSLPKSGYLIFFLRALNQAGLCITRARVRSQANGQTKGHTFYVMGTDGSMPYRSKVEAVCISFGGKLVVMGESDSCSEDDGDTGPPMHKFCFSFLDRHPNSEWESSSSTSTVSGSL